MEVRRQCSLGMGPDDKTPRGCVVKCVTVGAGIPIVYWAESQITYTSTVLRDMGRGPIFGTKQLKYKCSLSEEMAPTTCRGWLWRVGQQPYWMSEELVESEATWIANCGMETPKDVERRSLQQCEL